MKRFGLACLLFLALAVRTNADTFLFTFSGSVYKGSGLFTASPTVGPNPSISAFLVTDVAGTAMASNSTTSIAITGIAPVGTGAQGNDNILFYPGVNGNDFFDGAGVAFNLANGVNIDLFAYSGIYETIPGRGVLPDTGPITVTAVTPEPPALILLALPALAFIVCRLRGSARVLAA